MSQALNQEQLRIISKAGFRALKDQEQLKALIHSPELASELTVAELVELLTILGYCYRAGYPLVSDADYDFSFLAQLQRKDPDHPFLHQVEPELGFSAKTVPLPERMLSTDKAYNQEEIERWLKRLIKAAKEIDLADTEIKIQVTPKLDGYAAYDDGEILYTRGDGWKGSDISRAFGRGLQVAAEGERGLGPGEIVVKKTYFSRYLSDHFENARNFQAAILAEKKEDERVQQALNQGAAVFYPFQLLPNWQGSIAALRADFDRVTKDIITDIDFDVDGVILETTNEALKAHLGATRHHHRWQIALKANTERAQVRVVQVIPQTSRTGRVNPVVELEPTRLSGATISRATAHHYALVKKQKIGPKALIDLVRSGLVIPKIDAVIEPAQEVQIPGECPSCQHHLVWDKDYLVCPNSTGCPEQRENTLEHFFKSLRNNDGFGKKTIQKLCAHGVSSIHEIYQLSVEDLQGMGFGEKTAENLVQQRLRSQQEAIEDWRFLKAFGVIRLGGGNSERLLQHYSLQHIFNLTVDDLVQIDGFAQLSAEAIVEGLASIKNEFLTLYQLGFEIIPTPLVSELAEPGKEGTPIAGKTLVFTGKMQQGSREALQAQAKALGAKIGSSISSKTDLLVVGASAGAAKLRKAEELDIEVISEADYLKLLADFL